MKVYSWNMWYRNVKPDEAFEYLARLDFDVCCLQEVPEAFFERLKSLPHVMVSAVDVLFIRQEKEGEYERTLRHVILSRYPVIASGAYDLPPLDLPPRVYTLVRLKEGIVGSLVNRQSLYADIRTEQGLVRVFSLHVTLSSPSDRKREFEALEKVFPQFPVIVAGDFNVVEFPPWKLFNYLCGASWPEWSPWDDERTRVETLFKKWKLKNPLYRKVTLPISLSQLDHILVPETARVTRAEVSRQSYGSDHHPISVEIELA